MRAYVEPNRRDADAGRRVEIEIEQHDSVPEIIANIALPYLRRRQEIPRPGFLPLIWDEDLPKWLRRASGSPDAPPIDDGRDAERWSYVLHEMIWAMEETASGQSAQRRHVVDPGEYELTPIPADHTTCAPNAGYSIHQRKAGTVDMEGVVTDAERRREGLRLFVRYMSHLS